MKDRYSVFVRITGLLLIFRAIIFLAGAIMIAVNHAEARPSTINEVITPIIFTFVYFVYCAILSLRMSGAFLGSYNMLFRNRLNNLSHSDYKDGSDYARRIEENAKKGDNSSMEVDIKKLEEANNMQRKRIFGATTKMIQPRAAMVLLLIDLLWVIVLMLSLPELPKLFIGIAAEAITIIFAFIEINYETIKQ